jgi:hypothetical protein
MSWFAYAIKRLPDGRFDWMPTFAELRARQAAEGGGFDEVLDVELETAKEAALAAGWAGGFLERPRVFSLPCRDMLRFGFFWTQPVEGLAGPATFAIAPFELPWLGRPQAVAD